MLQLSCKFGESNSNPYCATVLTISSDTNHILEEHGDFNQLGPYEIPSDIMPRYIYPVRFVDQNKIRIELSC